MNWDWDKLQEKRQKQGFKMPEQKQEPQNNGSGDGGNNGNNGNNGNRNLKFEKIPNPLEKMNFKPSAGGFRYIVLIALAVWLASGIYIVNPDELGVVLRFGKYVDTVEAGPHYHLPYPIEEVYKPKVTQVQRLEIGFRSTGSTVTFRQGQNRVLPEEASMLTGDENIINIQFSVQYQIKDPVEYLFNVTNQAAVVKNAAEAAMREVIGNSKIDSALTDGKLQIQNEATVLLQSILDRYKVGVRVLAVQMQDVHPPKEVSEAFKDVASAREDKSRIINEAEAYRNEILPKARGSAAEIINQATGYKETRVLNAQGEASKFESLLKEYSMAKDVTEKRLYLEAMEEILSKSGVEKIILPKGGTGALPLIPVDRLLNQNANTGAK